MTKPDAREPQGDGELDSLRRELGLALPKDTEVLWVERQSGLDDMVRAKLRMKHAAFEELAPHLPIKLEELRAGAGRLGTDQGQWNPHATPKLRSGQASLAGGRYLNIGVAETGIGDVLVFVVNHGT